MSATDDARPKPAASRFLSFSSIALAILAGACAGTVIAALAPPDDRALFESRLAWADDAPEAPAGLRAGEGVELVRTRQGGALLVRAPRAERAREIAASLASRREARAAAIAAARDTLTGRWGAPAPAAHVSRWAKPTATDSTLRCAAWLLAQARWRRDLIAGAPAPWVTSDEATLPAPPEAVAFAIGDVVRATEARDVDALAPALVREAAREDEWFAAGVPSTDASLRRRAAVWRTWQRVRAESLESASARLVSALPVWRVKTLERDVAPALTELALRSPRPYEALARSLAPAWTPSASPIVDAWRRWLATGAAAGALAGAVLALLAAWLRPRRERGSMHVAMRDPGTREAWLHVVAGPTPAAVARAVVELAAHALARGERVLVVDGGTKLRLHERFDREARWGLMECLLADMPVIGLVQYGGRPGFYLLAHGNEARSEGWAAIGRRLDDARPHFGRIILAVDDSVPRAAGDALAGRALEGWWAAATPKLPDAAMALTARLGIAFSGMDLGVVPQASLEVLAGRARGLALLAPPAPIPAPLAEPEPVADTSSDPLVLDCDLQMRQRLRFLAWMRQVQSERRQPEAEEALR